MTIQRTREIFKGKFNNLSDNQVAEFIQNMDLLCDSLLQDTKHVLILANKKDNTKITKRI